MVAFAGLKCVKLKLFWDFMLSRFTEKIIIGPIILGTSPTKIIISHIVSGHLTKDTIIIKK
jgi:hypothetical protein